MSELKETMILQLSEKRLDLEDKLSWWTDRNLANTFLETQILNLDNRIDFLINS